MTMSIAMETNPPFIENGQAEPEQYLEDGVADDAILIKSKRPAERWILALAVVMFALTMLTVVLFILYDIFARSIPTRLPICSIDSTNCVGARQRYKMAALSSDYPLCSTIGLNFLKNDSSVVDAGLATLLCLGVANMQSAGVGGGGFLMVYDRASQTTHVSDGRETAPAKASRDMYLHNEKAASFGGMSIGVPGEIASYWSLHKRFGKVPWKDLFTPVISLCENGLPIGSGLMFAMKTKKPFIMEDKHLRDIFVDPKTNDLYPVGHVIRLPKLARTLRRISEGGAQEFYNGSLAADILEDIQEAGGIISAEDLRDYKTKDTEAMTISLSDGRTLHSVPPPSSGPLLGLAYNIMNGYVWPSDSLTCEKTSVLFHHRLIETWKFIYAIRFEMGDQDFVNMTQLMKNVTSKFLADDIRSKIDDFRTYGPEYYGDPGIVPDDSGTTHLSILDSKGNAFSATTSINLYFGSKVFGSRTGIFFNDGMDDFSISSKPNSFNLPPSPKNFIVPGKRAMSTMVPTIITEPNGEVRMVIGGSGGSKILTSTSYVLLRYLMLNDDLKEAVDAARLHHQWLPNYVVYEPAVPRYLLDGLKQKGHELVKLGLDDRGAVVQAITRDYIQAYADVRKGGCPAGYN